MATLLTTARVKSATQYKCSQPALANRKCIKSLSHGEGPSRTPCHSAVQLSGSETEATGKLPEGSTHLQPKEVQNVAARQQAYDCSPGHHNQSHPCSLLKLPGEGATSQAGLVTNRSCSPEQTVQNCALMPLPYLVILHSCLPAAQRNKFQSLGRCLTCNTRIPFPS